MYLDLELKDIKKDLKKHLSSNRYKHTEGVALTAKNIAKKMGVNIKKAELAGLLHDYAKGINENKLVELVKKSEWKVDNIEENLPSVLHAPVGAFLVQNKYDIMDKDILEAIRFHTIGSPHMGKLALIIFIADFIEPNRNYPNVNKLRKKMNKSTLEEMTVIVCDQSIKYNINKGRIIHPNTLLLRNEYLGGNN